MFDDKNWQLAIAQAAARMAPYLEPTPLLPARSLRELLGFSLYLKADCLQTTGSFKYRPALASILANLDEAKKRGVVTSSSGNFAVAVSHVAKMFDVRATIVTTPAVAQEKLDKARALGGNVVFCEPTYAARQQLVDQIKAETGAFELHSHSSVETIAGDATCAQEILHDLPEVKTVIVPTSGGGLLAGIALGIKQVNQEIRVFGVQSTGNDAFVRSFRAQSVCTTAKVDTICDGLVAAKPGPLGFDVALRHVDDMAAITDAEIAYATRLLVRNERLIVEPSGAVGIAALISSAFKHFEPPVVVVLSGGNVDLRRLEAF